MYTQTNNYYIDEDSDNDNSTYDMNDNNSNKKNILIKILIALVVILFIVWLVLFIYKGNGKALAKNDTTLINNVTAIRLASEKYFFIEKYLPKNGETLKITLKDMNDKGLVSIIRDHQNNACSTNSNESYASLVKSNIAYELTIKLTCDKEQKEIVYYYDLIDGKCLTCNGKTYMDGSFSLTDTNEEFENNENKPNDNNYDNELNINCKNWSEWTDKKIDNKLLLVRTKTFFKAYKTSIVGERIDYGEWSEYTATPINKTETVDVEVKEDFVEIWSEAKTTTEYITDSPTCKILSYTKHDGNSNCYDISETVRGELDAATYMKYNQQKNIVTLHKVYNKKENGKWILIYDATYKKIKRECHGSSSYTVYTYQELIKTPVTLYRSRPVIKKIIPGETKYTDYITELPEGYKKVQGSEITKYSYKSSTCK